MHDRVAEVLSQRATLDRGAGIGVVFSILLHAALAGGAIYTALHATAPEAAKMVSIQFAPMPAAAPAAPAPRRTEARPPAAVAPPKIEEPKIVEPKPVIEQKPTKPPEKNTVPLSPFGQSTKKGSETPAPAKPAAAPPAAPGSQPGTTTDVAIGESGITGIEGGGDFNFPDYRARMHLLIGDRWIRPSVTGPKVVIFLRIERNGTISESRIATPSGNGTFDRAALSAVRSASPLPPLPPRYPGSSLGIEMTFK